MIRPNVAQKSSDKRYFLCFLVGLTAFLVYANSLSHQFTLDDPFFFTQNKTVLKGAAGIPQLFAEGSMQGFTGEGGVQPYRPVTLASFALQKDFFGVKPYPAHLVNVLLYVAVCLLFFSACRKIFREADVRLVLAMALMYTVLPVHAEVVASVKSRDELLAALFGFAALRVFFGQDRVSPVRSLISALLFACAVFSKEGAIALLAVFPLATVLFRRKQWRADALSQLPLLGIAVLFLFVRQAVVGGEYSERQSSVLENVLFGAHGFSETAGTKLSILGLYFRLLFLPIQLSWDYSFNQVPVVGLASPAAIVSGLLCIGFLVIVLLQWKKQPVLVFGILFYFIALSPVGNFLYLIGTTAAERFLFLPSAGFAIALIAGAGALLRLPLNNLQGPRLRPATIVFATVVVLFAGRAVSRSAEWKDTLTVLESGVIASPNSARAHSALASEYRIRGEQSGLLQDRRKWFEAAIAEYRASIAILPEQTFSHYNLALSYQRYGDTARAFSEYRATLAIKPDHDFALNNLGALYGAQGQYDSALSCMRSAAAVKPSNLTYQENVGVYLYYTGQLDAADSLAQRLLQAYPDNTKAREILQAVTTARGTR
ncbi:MAG: tetratricopeptide repeat protein [Bacteroidota bacterium]